MKKYLYITLILILSCFVSATGAPFEWKAETVEGQLAVTVRIEAGYYLNLDSLLTEIKDAQGKLPPVVSLPPKQEINDPETGKTLILPQGTWRWVYGGTPPYQVKISFQGCKKAAPGEPPVCLMPEELTLAGGTPTPLAAAESSAVKEFYRSWKVVKRYAGAMNKEEFLHFLSEKSPGTESSSGNNVFADTALWLVVLLTLLGGLGLNLTPCVLPMIPINLAIIGAGESKSAGFRRGVLYGTGMAVAYGILGAAVVYTGGSFGALNSSSWFNFGIAVLFVVLAAAMLGVFNLDFSRFGNVNPGKIKGGREAVAFVMGGIAALLAGACVAPVVVSVMIFAAALYAQGNQFAPFMGLLLGVGMGLPWPFAAMGMAVLPKPGRFMVTIKYIFAILILAGAAYYAWLGWTLMPGNFSPRAEIAKLAEAGSRARAQKKAVVVDFYATWCKNCMVMKRTVLKDPEVRKALEKYEFVEFQAEKPGDPLIAPLLKLWNIPGFPAFVIAEP